MKRLLRLGGAVALASGLLWMLLPGAAGASTPARTAWWDMTPVGGGPPPGTTIPAPPPTTMPPTTLPGLPSTTLPSTTVPHAPGTTVPSASPSGNLDVGYDGAGATAIAAVDYVVPLGSGSQAIDPKTIDALLTLRLDLAGSAGTPHLAACPTTTSWSAGGDQPAKRAPRFNCTGGHASLGVYNSGSGAVNWNLSWLQEEAGQPGTFSVAIVPVRAGPAGAFNADFAKPAADSFQVLSWAPAGSGGSNPPVSEPPPPPTVPVAAQGSGGSPLPAGGGLPASSGGSGYVPGGGGTGGTTAGSSSGGFTPPSTAAPAPGYSLGPTRPTAAHLTPARAARDVGIGILIALGVLLFSASNRAGRKPRLLVPLPIGVTSQPTS